MKVFLTVLSLSVATSHAFYSGNANYESQQELVRVARQPQYPAPQPVYGEQPANYDFEWQVKDDYSRNDYGHKESRKDQQTQGSYHVALPDGRIQTVTYSVDGYGGYVADVSYSGQAVYPEARPYAPPAPAPYKPAPAPAPAPYRPAPAPVPLAPTPAPYRPQPVVAPIPLPQLSYQPQPTPAPYRPQPAPYRPQPAPYRPQPIQPYAAASVQSPTYAAAPEVRRYTFKTAAAEVAPAAEEVEAVPAESAPAAEVVEPRSAALVLDEPVEVVEPVVEATERALESFPEVAPEVVANEETTSQPLLTNYRYYY